MRLLKPTLVFLLLIISTTSLRSQQIPNGGFEEWELWNTWNETPTGWFTQNFQLNQNTVKDSFPNSGDWAMRIYPVINSLGELGYAETVIDMSELPTSLDFYAKWEKTPTAAVSVEVTFLNEYAIVSNNYWGANIDTSGWVNISLPINQEPMEITHAQIRVSVHVGDFAPGDGWIAMDDMGFNIASGLEELDQRKNIIISPNPCDNQLNINTKNILPNMEMVVYDMIGHLIYVGKVQSSYDTSQLANGTYILQIGEGIELIKEKFQVKH